MAINISKFTDTHTHAFSQDPSGETTVTIRKIDQAGYYALGEDTKDVVLEYDSAEVGKTKQYQSWNVEHIRTMECYLTFVDAEGLMDDSKPLFKAGMGQAQFFRSFGKLPRAIAREWMDAVRQFNPSLVPGNTDPNME